MSIRRVDGYLHQASIMLQEVEVINSNFPWEIFGKCLNVIQQVMETLSHGACEAGLQVCWIFRIRVGWGIQEYQGSLHI